MKGGAAAAEADKVEAENSNRLSTSSDADNEPERGSIESLPDRGSVLTNTRPSQVPTERGSLAVPADKRATLTQALVFDGTVSQNPTMGHNARSTRLGSVIDNIGFDLEEHQSTLL